MLDRFSEETERAGDTFNSEKLRGATSCEAVVRRDVDPGVRRVGNAFCFTFAKTPLVEQLEVEGAGNLGFVEDRRTPCGKRFLQRGEIT